MSEQDNSARIEEKDAGASGLLLSVEPLAGGEKLYAQKGDGTDTDTDLMDKSDAADADGTDESEGDGTDMTDGEDASDSSDTDGSDSLSTDSDGSDSSSDTDGSDT